MKIELNLPDGTLLTALYQRGPGWGAIVRSLDGFWPSRYRETFKDLRPPEPKFHSCSGASAGCVTMQEAIDVAYEKMVLNMNYLDGITRAAAPQREPKAVDPSILAGLDLGDIDL